MLPIDKDKSVVDALKKTQTLRASETQKKKRIALPLHSAASVIT